MKCGNTAIAAGQKFSGGQNFNMEIVQMNTIQKRVMNVTSPAVLSGLLGCTGISTQDKNTAVGIVIGNQVDK